MDLDPNDMRDVDLLAYLSHNAVPEPEVVHLMMRAVRAGDTVIDGGANIGYFTLLLSKLVGDSGQVIAVEPSPPNLKKLRHNLEINKVTNVEVVPKALCSGVDNAVPFYLTAYGGYDSLTKTDRTIETIQVEATTLQSVTPGDWVRLIKLDLEGAEIETLAGHHPHADFVIAEAHEEHAGVLRTVLTVRGYATYMLHADGSLPSGVPLACKLLPKAENSNLLFSRPDEVIEAWPEVLY